MIRLILYSNVSIWSNDIYIALYFYTRLENQKRERDKISLRVVDFLSFREYKDTSCVGFISNTIMMVDKVLAMVS